MDGDEHEKIDTSSLTASGLRSILRLREVTISGDKTTKAYAKIASSLEELGWRQGSSSSAFSRTMSNPKSKGLTSDQSNNRNKRASIGGGDSEDQVNCSSISTRNVATLPFPKQEWGFNRLPRELQLEVWDIFTDSIDNDSNLSEKEREKIFIRLVLVDKQWYHKFAKRLFSDEVQVAKVLSNNLQNTSPENVKRIEEYYAYYVTAIEHIGKNFHENYKLFWQCLDSFNFKIKFPNVHTLKISGEQIVNIVPRIQLGPRIAKLVLYQGYRKKTNYTMFTEFCQFTSQLPLTIYKVVFCTMRGSKLVSACKPIVSCHVKRFVIEGCLNRKAMELLASSQAFISIRICQWLSEPKATFVNLIKRLDVWLNLDLLLGFSQLQFSSLDHLYCAIEQSDFDELLNIIPLNCPRLRVLDLFLRSDGVLRSNDRILVGNSKPVDEQVKNLSHVIDKTGDKFGCRLEALGILMNSRGISRCEVVSQVRRSKLKNLKYLKWQGGEWSFMGDIE